MMRSVRWRAVAAAGLLLAGCDDAGLPAGDGQVDLGDAASADAAVEAGALDRGPGEGGAEGGGDAAQADATSADAAQADAASGPPPSKLPFSYMRPDVGQPVTAAELKTITTKYLELLKETRWFDVVDERVHGWPQSDPAKQYWYGTWWSGVSVIKKGGKVTYLHSKDGADNNGLRTAQLMEGACHATLLWGAAADEALLHKLIRGFSSWILAFEQTSGGPAQTLLSRAAYPKSISSTDGGRALYIDYSLNRPGVDNGATSYVHLPTNPHWGDLYVKNMRSKDDLGPMFRALAQVESCAGRLTAPAAKSMAQMRTLYKAWSVQLEQDKWVIATLDKQLKLFFPLDTLARFINVGGVECSGMLAIRLMGQGTPGTLNCGSGISLPEALGGELIKSGNKQMLRTYHEAATNQALNAGEKTVALDLLKGLAQRLAQNMSAIEAGKQPSNLNTMDFTALILHAASAGVPLTSREVRWVHKRIEEAHSSYRTAAMLKHYKVFDPKTPDGTYAYEPIASGFFYNDSALPLGTCASPYRNPAGRPLLDCSQVLQWR